MGAIGVCPICHPIKPVVRYRIEEYCKIHGIAEIKKIKGRIVGNRRGPEKKRLK